ncbi:C40 family peptidase [Bacillus velezensis]|uniref:C40 family peptidase n=1 Tax=Bacillus velezensis TaxID=492670 RepID=UPI001F5CC621|nr:C40 family peptidase [Bacillus velezensis]
MASNKKKQEYNQKQYEKKLKEAKEVYKKRKEYVASFNLPKTEEKLESEASEDKSKSSSKGNAVKDEGGSKGVNDPKGIFALGKTKMKAPYVFGAAGPNSFDCSGFVYWVYNHCGYKFGRTTAAGYYSMFQKTSSPQPGDLVFFSGTYKGGISHIGIYMGNHTMLHTANPEHGVQISDLNLPYWKQHFSGYRRIQDSYYHGSSSSSTTKKASSKANVSSYSTFQQESVIGDDSTYPPKGQEGTYVDPNTPVYSYSPLDFFGRSIIQSKESRSVFLTNRVGWARTTNYKGFRQLNKERFIHQVHYDGYEGNLYSPDAKTLFENLLLKTQKPYFEIISGFRFSNKGQLSPHEAGCAMDIHVRNIEEVREIADCAWQLGVRSIAMGGDFTASKGFIHLDIAPKENNFTYDGLPIYGGPGRWEIR